MVSYTPNYNLAKPGVNDPTDQDLWGGYLNDDMDTIDSTMKSISDSVAQTRLPVGSLYFNADVATNPGTLLGYGTWVAFAEGRVVLGVGQGTDSNGYARTFAAGETTGEYRHKQTGAEVGEHDHDIPNMLLDAQGRDDQTFGRWRGGSTYSTSVNQAQANVTPMQWLQPSIAVYIWKRTA